jgi:predicted transcriptional regulator
MATTKHRITVTLEDEDYQRLDRIAHKFGKSLSWVAAYAIKGLTKEVGTKKFMAFKQWASEQSAEAEPRITPEVLGQ